MADRFMGQLVRHGDGGAIARVTAVADGEDGQLRLTVSLGDGRADTWRADDCRVLPPQAARRMIRVVPRPLPRPADLTRFILPALRGPHPEGPKWA